MNFLCFKFAQNPGNTARLKLLHASRSKDQMPNREGLRVKAPAFARILGLAVTSFSLLSAASSSTSDRQPITEALEWLRATPQHVVQYNYGMSARVRLLLFWAGKDDVGGGYIRRGVSAEDPRKEFFQVLFGSDPAKAPRAINRWGAGTEISWHKQPVNLSFSQAQDDVTASAFFGFMKSSRGKSAAEMQQELKSEREAGQHSFTGILSRVEPASAFSLVTHLESDTDYNLHDYDEAEPVMLERLTTSSQPIRSLEEDSRCPRAEEFLASVAELIDAALAGHKGPESRCYVYDAQENILTLEHISPVNVLPVQLHGPHDSLLLDTSYSNLLELDYVSTHKATAKKVYFSIFVGTQGKLRDVPVQIRYQPNWWFQVVLNLLPGEGTPSLH
jgi:hypothetical protein